jgi:hypothetical protein
MKRSARFGWSRVSRFIQENENMDEFEEAFPERTAIKACRNERRFAGRWLPAVTFGLMLVGSAQAGMAWVGMTANLSVPTSAAPAQTAQACSELQNYNQAESRDSTGKITVEAALIHVVTCNGRQFYIYQYLKRAGFRAVLPPDYGHAIGGRDFATYAEALAAALAVSKGGTAAPRAPQAPGPGGGPAKAIKWSDLPLVAARGNDKDGQRSTYTCPPNCDPKTFDSRIYGTDIYTDDSSVCVCAVHAGLISFAQGGTVTVQVKRPGLNKYTGSTRNGVTSNNYDNGAYPSLGAFAFVR